MQHKPTPLLKPLVKPLTITETPGTRLGGAGFFNVTAR